MKTKPDNPKVYYRSNEFISQQYALNAYFVQGS